MWTREIGTSSADQANAIATDSAGNIFVTGVTYGSLDGNPNLGEGDLFVAKLDAQGATLWMRQLGSTAWDGATGAACDGTGDVYVVGYSRGGFDGNSSTPTAARCGRGSWVRLGQTRRAPLRRTRSGTFMSWVKPRAASMGT